MLASFNGKFRCCRALPCTLPIGNLPIQEHCRKSNEFFIPIKQIESFLFFNLLVALNKKDFHTKIYSCIMLLYLITFIYVYLITTLSFTRLTTIESLGNNSSFKRL